jgi:DNA-binding NtrC family response regulator
VKNWRSILLLALVFLAGLAVGVVGTRVVLRRVIQQALVHPERVQALVERDLTRKLQLDGDQQARLHEILTDTRGQLQALRQEYRPQAVALYRGADEKILALLTPEQQTLYEKLKQENHPLWRALQKEP